MDKIVRNNYIEIYKIIKKNLYECKTDNKKIKNAKYHHNTKYCLGENIVKYGILSLEERLILENRKMTEKELITYNDYYHVNGSEYISLSTNDIDYNLISKNEMIYNSNLPDSLDILISDNIFSRRSSINYANEYLVYKKISPKKIKSIDIRLLSLCNILLNDNNLNMLIDNYNYIISIALEILKNERNIMIREVSNEKINLDIELLSNMPKLILKK